VGVFILSSSPLKKEIGMRRTVLVLLSAAVALLLASGAVLALPSERPDNTPMIDGRVRAIEQVGTNIWLGGHFSRVEQRNGTLLGRMANVFVFDSKTNTFKNIGPKLGGTDFREEIDPPLVEVQDNRLDLLRPGVTTTVTYTELMVP
jgi:hypothetical protein